MEIPLIGTFEWLSWQGAVVGLGLLLLLAVVLPQVRNLTRRIPLVGGASPAVAGVILLLVASVANPGGMLYYGGSAAPGTIADDVTFATGLYEQTTDVTFTAADFEDKTALGSVSVKVYEPGVTEKAAFEGSATPEYSGTMSSGTVTISGVQVQTLGCTVDVALDLSGYYEQIERDVNICVEKNALGNNDLSVPTFYMKDIGTLSLSDDSATTLTCTAGSQCTYNIKVSNTEDDSWVAGVAVKWVESDTEEHTLDSVDAGACEIVEVSSTKYVKFTGDLGPLASAACAVKITRATGDTNGGYNMTADDLFVMYGATAWNTNANLRSATATAALEVTFA